MLSSLPVQFKQLCLCGILDWFHLLLHRYDETAEPGRSHCTNLSQNFTFPSGEMEAFRPIGVLPGIQTSLFYYPCGPGMAPRGSARSHPSFEFHKYLFMLNDSLRLNLTLRNLYISSFRETCRFERISIFCWHGRKGKYCPHEGSLIYCATYSEIHCYPEHNEISITVRTTPFVILKVQMSYSIIDSGLVKTNIINRKNPYINWVMNFPKVQVQIWHIVLKNKFKHLVLTSVLTSQGEKIKVHDGPGDKSPVVKGQTSGDLEAKYTTTTFQVFINSLQFKNTSGNLTYVESSQNKTTSIVLPNDTVITLPDFCVLKPRLRGVCFLSFKVEENFSVNVTFSEFNDEHHNTESCDHSGIAVYDDHDQEIFKDCVKIHYGRTFELKGCHQSYSIVQIVSRFRYTVPKSLESHSVYSNSNAVTLVFYSYPEYSSLSLNITASSTECRVVSGLLCDHLNFPKKIWGYSPHLRIPWDLGCLVYYQRFGLSTQRTSCRQQIKTLSWEAHGKLMIISGSGWWQGSENYVM